MHPIRLLKLLRRANTLGNLFQEAAVSKSLFKSTIFWAQVLTAALELSQVLPLPTGGAAATGAVITILLRLLRQNGPVHVV